ncbi:4Fe-4S binding protein [Thaumasiovibrio sp. DFM-14]|uniref:FMN-binding protein n=1 Tax=Thaumasiovibrio sp. DFM-14 TaxID=3384792 RepID=UPI0039A16254
MKKSTSKSKQLEKILSIFSILLFVVAWYLGGERNQHNQLAQLTHLMLQAEQLTPTGSNSYRGVSVAQDGSETVEWISVGHGIGYGGEMTAGINVSPSGKVQSFAVIASKETSSYLHKVMQSGIADRILGQSIESTVLVDSVTGATLTTNALNDAIDRAAEPVREQLFNFRLSEPKSVFATLQWLDAAALLVFAIAVWASRTRHKNKVQINWVVLTISMGLFGFYSASLYTSATMGMLMSGVWWQGLASFTPLILLLLSVGYILYYNRNIYCQNLCPFGAVQQCLAKVGNAKASTLKHSAFLWFPRFLLLATLCLGAYFRNPVAFSYEPFGIMFGMIGTMYLFVLTILIILTSLLVRRPWCQTLCPIKAMTDFLTFNKTWYKQAQKQREKQRRQLKKEAQGEKAKGVR